MIAHTLSLANTVSLRPVQRTSTEPLLAALRLSGSNRQTATEEGSADWVLEVEPLSLRLCPASAGCLRALAGLVQSAIAGVDAASPPPPGVPSCCLISSMCGPLESLRSHQDRSCLRVARDCTSVFTLALLLTAVMAEAQVVN